MEGKLIKLGEGKYDLLVDFDPKVLEGYELSLTNCQAIERGYDLDELVENEENKHYALGLKHGFQKVLELMRDRKFTEEDMRKAYRKGEYDAYYVGAVSEKENNYIQSLQKTEWNVTFNPEEKDAEGHLLLKRK